MSSECSKIRQKKDQAYLPCTCSVTSLSTKHGNIAAVTGAYTTPILIQCGSEFLIAEVHHAQILTAKELEMLEPLLHAGQYSLLNLLKTKTGDEFWMVQSMKNYPLRGLKIEEQSSEYLPTRYHEITARMRQVIKDEVDLPDE